ncbi:MAG: hypothetical protein HKO96_06325, partial [Flavobacteriaceae bacterium]|nr:hypothetical protein [Flavobacteriaceae bacterium]
RNLSFLDFTEITYQEEPIADFMKGATQSASNMTKVFVNFEKDGKVVIGREFAMINTDRDGFIQTLKGLSAKYDQIHLVFLNFSSELSVQDYISIKSDLQGREDARLLVARDEFIYK